MAVSYQVAEFRLLASKDSNRCKTDSDKDSNRLICVSRAPRSKRPLRSSLDSGRAAARTAGVPPKAGTQGVAV